MGWERGFGSEGVIYRVRWSRACCDFLADGLMCASGLAITRRGSEGGWTGHFLFRKKRDGGFDDALFGLVVRDNGVFSQGRRMEATREGKDQFAPGC